MASNHLHVNSIAFKTDRIQRRENVRANFKFDIIIFVVVFKITNTTEKKNLYSYMQIDRLTVTWNYFE